MTKEDAVAPNVPCNDKCSDLVVCGRYPIGDFMRYRLSNRWFIDRAERSYCRYDGHKYTAWEPGASPEGCAAYRGGASSLRGLLAALNAKRAQPITANAGRA